jgi:fructose-1-phosphate kinase PfkB-like protein
VLGPYSVGAGDAFLGGFAAAILQGDDLRSAAIAGTAAAAASTLVPGPGRIDVAASIRMRREVRVEPIGRPDGSSG